MTARPTRSPAGLANGRAVAVPSWLVLLAAVALAYWPVVHGGFVWDDDDYVTQNPVLRTAGGLLRIWFEPTSLPQYYPLVHTTFWLEYRLWGAAPLGYHLVNVALHLATAGALLRLLRRLAVPGALFAAVLFAVHPVHVESVAWVTERKNVLSAFCLVIAAHGWLGWRDGGPPGAWWRATAWFAAALLAKTVTATLPIALLLVVWWRSGRVTRRDVAGVAAWLVLGAITGGTTAWLEAHHVRAADAAWQLHGAERLLVAGRAPWFYLGSLLWPLGCSFNYPRWQLDTAAPSQWLPVLATLAVPLTAILAQRRLGRGPAAAALLFLALLAPALGFFDVYPFRFAHVADHFQYHADLAAIPALVALAMLAARRLPTTARLPLATAFAIALAVLASLLVGNYRDLETSWRAVLARHPDSQLALTNLAGELLQRGDTAAAEPLLTRCLARHPDSYEALAGLGQIAQLRGDAAQARSCYERSLALRADNQVVLRNFAELLLQQHRAAEALPLAQRAVVLDGDFYDGRVTLAAVQLAVGDPAAALEHANWVLVRTPDVVATRLVAARSLLALGRFDPAAQNAGLLVRRVPGLVAAQDVFAEALARLLQQRPVDGIAEQLAHMLQSGPFDGRVLVPKVAAALRAIGAGAHAAALGN